MWIDDVNALFIADITREQLVDGLVAKFTIWVRVLEITRYVGDTSSIRCSIFSG